MLRRVSPGAFRFFLAFVVLVHHSCRFDLGDWAVYLFFMLSGYWIHRMWTQKYSRARAPVAVFLASRLLRLLPVFWLTNLLSAVVQRAIDPTFLNPAGPMWSRGAAAASNILLLGYANLPHPQGALHAAWTLDVEMQFYLAFPLVLFLLSRPRAGTRWQVVFGVACLAGLAMYLAPTLPPARNLCCYGIFFLAGMVSAHREWAPSKAWAAGAMWTFLALVILCSAAPGLRYLVENAKHGASAVDLHHKLIFNAVLALISAPFALFTVRNTSSPFDRRVSELTYTVYLAQWPVMALHGFYFEHLPPMQRIPSVLVAWVAVAAVSWAIFRYFDQPLEGARKRWVSSQMAA